MSHFGTSKMEGYIEYMHQSREISTVISKHVDNWTGPLVGLCLYQHSTQVFTRVFYMMREIIHQECQEQMRMAGEHIETIWRISRRIFGQTRMSNNAWHQVLTSVWWVWSSHCHQSNSQQPQEGSAWSKRLNGRLGQTINSQHPPTIDRRLHELVSETWVYGAMPN